MFRRLALMLLLGLAGCQGGGTQPSGASASTFDQETDQHYNVQTRDFEQDAPPFGAQYNQ
jgi:hypothetical protein